jgi:hypothetical protein
MRCHNQNQLRRLLRLQLEKNVSLKGRYEDEDARKIEEDGV